MSLIVRSSLEFREAVLKELNFSPSIHKECTLYQDPKNQKMGHFLLYERPGYYEFGIADYTVAQSFQIQFENPQRLVRFGTVYKGTTEFQLDNEPVSSFKPSSFFVVEKDLKGTQAWSAGQHFHGAEITIYEAYFEEVIQPLLGTSFDFNYFVNNFTYHYLPIEVMSILQTMQARSHNHTLDPLFLESCLLQCVSIFIETVKTSPNNAFTNQLYQGKVQIGEDRYLTLTVKDIQSIHKAHDILTKKIEDPPTIERLSQQVMLNPQKLKAGFKHQYHLSIGEYITSLRMTLAVNLLCTTDMSIADISEKVGYRYTGNFIKMFRQTYDCTPLKYRQNNRR